MTAKEVEPGTSNVPRKASEFGACKDLEGHIFTINSGNKGKDGDVLCTSKEKMTTYIGTKYGDNATQEWTSKKRIVLSPKPFTGIEEHCLAESLRGQEQTMKK